MASEIILQNDAGVLNAQYPNGEPSGVVDLSDLKKISDDRRVVILNAIGSPLTSGTITSPHDWTDYENIEMYGVSTGSPTLSRAYQRVLKEQIANSPTAWQVLLNMSSESTKIELRIDADSSNTASIVVSTIGAVALIVGTLKKGVTV